MRRLMIVTMILSSTVAFADTIEEKRQKEDAEKLVASNIKSMNKTCKTAIPDAGVIDWASWKTIVDEKNNKAGSSCKYVAYGIESLCRSDKIAQETVAKDVKKLTCLGDGADDVTFEMKGDTLVIHTKLGVKDTDKKTKTWLTKNLQ
jgi:hypothetical protein